MPDNQFIILEELSKTTQALLSKINEQSNLKVNKNNVKSELNSGTKIGSIEGVEFYAPEIDTSNLATQDDLGELYTDATDYNNLRNKPSLAAVATSGSYYDLSNTPNCMIKGQDRVTAGQKSETTLGGRATAEGYQTTASGNNSHAEGVNTIASGYSSHAEGAGTTASGNNSHTEGYKTIAQRQSQHVFGECNILDTEGSSGVRGQYVEIVGNGTNDTSRSNARTLDWNGNEWLAGKLTIGAAPTANMDVTTKQYVDGAITTAIGNVNSFNVNIVSGDLPTTNIDTHTIYFKSNSSSGNNVYDEYMYINNNWELIGSTAIDLTPYARSANLATVATSGDYDDLTDAPAAETDANVETMLDSFNLDYTSNSSSSSGGGVTKVEEITISTAGTVTQALDAGKIYHFTGALTALTITLNAPVGTLAEYHFDFLSGSTAPTLTIPDTVIMPNDFTVEANKRYEINVLNNYGVVTSWTNS